MNSNDKNKEITKEVIKDKLKDGLNDYATKRFAKQGDKSGSRRRRGRGGRGRKQSQISRGRQFNDVSYYNKNKSITDAFCNLPFSWIVGNPVVNLKEGLTLQIPAIVSYMIDWVSNVGTTRVNAAESDYFQGDADILDQVATIIYAQMRRSNSGSTNNIEHVDVIISNLIASIDICVNVHYIHRMFKIANTFSWRNRLIPNYIFAHHFNLDYDDFIANQANYRGEFNILVAMARTIRTLANFPFIDAIMDEFDNIFKDSDTDNGREQMIVSVKPLHHIYDPYGYVDLPGGCVRLMELRDIGIDEEAERIIWTGVPRTSSIDSDPKLKFSFLLKILRAQINALITDNDFNLIQADIEKAFGEQSGYIVVDPISDVSTITPIYSGEFNLMFTNGRFYQVAYDHPNDQWNYVTTTYAGVGTIVTLKEKSMVNIVYQSNDAGESKTKLEYALMWKVGYGDSMDSINEKLNLLNIESENPTSDEIIIATRFKNTPNMYNVSQLVGMGVPSVLLGSSTDMYHVPSSCSNFICWGGNVTVVSSSATGAAVDIMAWNNTTNTQPAILLGLEHPPMFADVLGVIFDNINNIRGVSASELHPIQKACFLSLWNLPDRTNI